MEEYQEMNLYAYVDATEVLKATMGNTTNHNLRVECSVHPDAVREDVAASLILLAGQLVHPRYRVKCLSLAALIHESGIADHDIPF